MNTQKLTIEQRMAKVDKRSENKQERRSVKNLLRDFDQLDEMAEDILVFKNRMRERANN